MIRTTVSIQEELLKKLKESTHAENKTLSERLNEILSDHFRPKKKTQAYSLDWKVVAGREPPAVDPADRDQLYHYLEAKK